MFFNKAECLPTWDWCRSFISMAETPWMYAGWIPSISHTLSLSITLSRCHYVTLTLFNFETQLNQSSLLLICNYYVFSIVTDFVLQQIEQLKCLISMLGGFYTAKSSLHCNCKFIKINGLFDTLKKPSTCGMQLVPIWKIILWNVDAVRGFTKTKMECFLEKKLMQILQKLCH